MLTTAPDAHAAPSAVVSIDQLTGTAPFNGSVGPGMDTSATDDVVRTNDTVEYQIAVSAPEGLTAPTITVEFPRGEEMKSIPAFCGAGSTLSDPPAAPDFKTLTASSWESLAAQTLECVVGDIPAAGAAGYTFTTKVRPEMPDGHKLGPVKAIVSSDGLESPAESNEVEHFVSAAAKWDLSINGVETVPNTVFVRQGTYQQCTNAAIGPTAPGGRINMCWHGGYSLTLAIPDGGKGGSPMDGGNFSFELPADAVSVWGQEAVDAAKKQGIELPGAYYHSIDAAPQSAPGPGLEYRPNQVYNVTMTENNSVRTSGAFSASQPGGGGGTVTVNVNGADTTGYTVPQYVSTPAGKTVRDDRGYVVSLRIWFQVPIDQLITNQAILDNLTGFDQNIDTAVNAAKVLENNFTFTVDEKNLKYTSIEGLAKDANQFSDAAYPDNNNWRTAAGRLQDNQPVHNSWISPVKYATATLPQDPDPNYQPGDPYGFSSGFAAWYGPSGPTAMDRGDGVAVGGQVVINNVQLDGDTLTGTTTLACTAFDNTKSVLEPDYVYPNGAVMQQLASNQPNGPNYPMDAYRDFQLGGATWVMATFMDWGGGSLTVPAPDRNRLAVPDRVGDFRVQYGIGEVDDQSCTGAIKWYDAPAATGADTKPLPAGDLSNVNKVRIFIQNHPSPANVFQRTNIGIGMRVLDGLAPGSLIPSWTNYVQVAGDKASWDSMIALPAENWVRTKYDPAADVAGILDNTDRGYRDGAVPNGRSGDVLTAVDVVANIVKQVQTGTDAADEPSYAQNLRWVPGSSGGDSEWATTAAMPKYGPGARFSFKITPKLYAKPAVQAGTIRSVLIEECLPESLVPDANTTTVPWNYQGDEPTPYPRQLNCAAGEYYLGWWLPDVDISQPLRMPGAAESFDDITLGARVLETAFSAHRVNETRISVLERIDLDPMDEAPGALFKSAVPSNVDQRTALAGFDIEAPDGIRIAKATITPIIFVDPIGWTSSPYAVWNVSIRNLNSGQPLSDVDMIDFLPRTGVNGSLFHGLGRFRDAIVSNPGQLGTDNVTILYTKQIPTNGNFAELSDPASAANQADGSTVWCAQDASGGYAHVSGKGTDADCPTGPVQVTGIRVQRPGEFENQSILRIRLRAWASDNVGGDPAKNVEPDMMHNSATMRIKGMDVPLTSDDWIRFDARDVPPNTAALEGDVWDDLNSNGIWDAGEPPMAGVVVKLQNLDRTPALDPQGRAIVALTDEFGHYIHWEIQAGTEPDNFRAEYQVVFETPSGYVPTIEGGDSTPQPIKVYFDKGQQYLRELDHGYRKAPELALTKTAVVGDGTPTAAQLDDVVTYTVTATNTSTDRPFTDYFPARLFDDLSDALDNGELVGTPTASTGRVSMIGSAPEQQLVWYGALEPGASASIEYRVRVTSAPELVNVAFASNPPVDPTTGRPIDPDTDGPVPAPEIDPETGQPILVPTDPRPEGPVPAPAPEDCTAPACATTTTAVEIPDASALTVAKQVSASEALPGDVLTYTVTFNYAGDVPYTTARPATFVDDLSGVLDDAGGLTVVSASAGHASIHGDYLIWSGPIAKDVPVTVVYTVAVTGAGDLAATNIAFPAPDLPRDPDTGGPLEPIVTPDDCQAPTCATTTTSVLPDPNSLTIAKSASQSVANPGDRLRYTITVTNPSAVPFTTDVPAKVADELSGVLDDADLVADSLRASAGNVELINGRLVWSGPLGAHGTVTISYEVLVNDGDGDELVTNVAFLTTDDPAVAVVPEDCVEGSCVSTTTPVVIEQVEVAKQASAASTQPGATLSYSLTVKNTGSVDLTAERPASIIDDLSGVLDGADLAGTPTASAGEVKIVGERLVWSGPLAAGAEVVIEYAVTITDGGDRRAINKAFVTTGSPIDPDTGMPIDPVTGEPVPTPVECNEPTCTSTVTPVLVQALAVAKQVSAATAEPGQQLSYTVTVKNTGNAAYTVEDPATLVDDLSGVLDDADLATDSLTASAGSARLVDDRLVWSGPVSAGGTVTIEYAVTVKAGGDQNVKNIAFNTTGMPLDPDTGQPVDPDTGDPVAPPSPCADDCATTETEVEVPAVTPTPTPGRPTKLPATGVGAAPIMLLTVVGVGAAAFLRSRNRTDAR